MTGADSPLLAFGAGAPADREAAEAEAWRTEFMLELAEATREAWRRFRQCLRAIDQNLGDPSVGPLFDQAQALQDWGEMLDALADWAHSAPIGELRAIYRGDAAN